MANQRFVEKIAQTYLRRYKDVGFESAAEYAERIVNGDAELSERVRVRVNELVKEAFGGNKNGKDKT